VVLFGEERAWAGIEEADEEEGEELVCARAAAVLGLITDGFDLEKGEPIRGEVILGEPRGDDWKVLIFTGEPLRKPRGFPDVVGSLLNRFFFGDAVGR